MQTFRDTLRFQKKDAWKHASGCLNNRSLVKSQLSQLVICVDQTLTHFPKI